MLDFKRMIHVFGFNLVLYALILLVPILVSLIYAEFAYTINFGYLFLCCLGVGFLIYIATLQHTTEQSSQGTNELNNKEGYLITVVTWFLLCVLSSLPFYLFLEGELQLSFVDALFEGTSGLTTTGGTILRDIEALPMSMLFYRQFLQWVGGLGIIILAVAILPMLGIGGTSLFNSEKTNYAGKLLPKIKDVSKYLFYIYISMTALCTIAYDVSGMKFVDALMHSFSTVSLGGFSTYNDSFMHFNGEIQFICALFIFIGSINFTLHYLYVKTGDAKVYTQNAEFRTYVWILAIVVAIVFLSLANKNGFDGVFGTLFHSIFSVISIMTTTGFVSTDFFNWGAGLPVVIMLLSFIGGCAGSTSGGMKVIRFMILAKQAGHELGILISPHKQSFIQSDNQQMPTATVLSVFVFFVIYIWLFFVLLIALCLSGMPFYDAFFALAANLNNAGQSIGSTAMGFFDMSSFQKVILSIAMVIGRIEVLAVMIILMPKFWRY